MWVSRRACTAPPTLRSSTATGYTPAPRRPTRVRSRGNDGSCTPTSERHRARLVADCFGEWGGDDRERRGCRALGEGALERRAARRSGIHRDCEFEVGRIRRNVRRRRDADLEGSAAADPRCLALQGERDDTARSRRSTGTEVLSGASSSAMATTSADDEAAPVHAGTEVDSTSRPSGLRRKCSDS